MGTSYTENIKQYNLLMLEEGKKASLCGTHLGSVTAYKPFAHMIHFHDRLDERINELINHIVIFPFFSQI